MSFPHTLELAASGSLGVNFRKLDLGSFRMPRGSKYPIIKYLWVLGNSTYSIGFG